MSFLKYKELNNLKDVNDVEKEIFVAAKEILDLKFKKATNQTIKSHLFIHLRRRIAQLQYKKSALLQEKI
uniref:Ribosomal protein L29 n=1 Tax=Synura sphagnicola TaxID=52556 RepID=A0A3G2QYS9_9STRA|nr:ribosomal protein L29 [Synura sphagnicola]